MAAAEILVVWVLAFLYCLTLSAIFFFALMQSQLLFWHVRGRKEVQTPPTPLKAYPLVTVQLPLYNEPYVIERLLRAVDALTYPKENLQIQVLDDSTDHTSDLVAQVMKTMKRRDQVSHIRRKNREGYKAGALKNGLKTAKGEFLALFDADFVPPEDFLLRTLPFFKDGAVGFVQVPWSYLNDNQSFLTRLQAAGLWAHFLIEQSSRQAGSCFIHFNGTAGVWRKSCILSAGNWSSDTLTEDIDLSYRAQMKGWKYRYVTGYQVPSELPASVQAVKTQYRRWSQGNMQNLIKHFMKLCRMPLGIKKKWHALYFLASSGSFFLIFCHTLLSVPLLWLKSRGHLSLLFALATLFFFSLCPYAVLHLYACRANERIKGKWCYFLKYFPGFLAFSMSLSFNNSLGIIGAWLRPHTPFIRTPKWGTSGGSGYEKNRTKGATLGLLTEIFLFLYVLFGFFYGLYHAEYSFLLFHGLLCAGYACLIWHGGPWALKKER